MTLHATPPTQTDPATRSTRRRRSAATRLTDGLLSVLALAGVVCIVAVICAFAFNVSLIMFKTGSMSPTISTGSLAVVREVPAADLRVGDVATIDRPGQLPVTHRVTSMHPVGEGSFSIRMKGDANDSEDAQPYVVSTARKVLWSVPEVGYFVGKAQNPATPAVATLALAMVVTWAFWPRKPRSA